MAVYKVIQDVEAEDKIVGFLTLKSFIYAIIAVALAYINFRLFLASAVGPLRFVFVLVFTFPMLLFGVLAAPLGRDQPTEVWILSHVRFFLKSRRRIWDQSGVQELVTITAPKKIERALTKNLSQREVQSRLRALAATLDTRGWAVKNVAVNLGAQPSYLDVAPEDSDRLVGPSSLPQDQSQIDVNAADDIMDEQNNPTAQNFLSLMQQADVKRKEGVRDRLNSTLQEQSAAAAAQTAPIDSSFLDQVEPIDNHGNTSFVGHTVVVPDQPEPVQVTSTPSQPAMTPKPQNAKLRELMEVAKSDKLSTLSKEANRAKYRVKQVGNEVEIDLH